MKKVCHLNAQKQRLFGEFDIEGVIAAVLGNDRQVGLLLERLEGGFYTKHVLRAVGKSGHEVFIAKVHVNHLRGEDNVSRLVETYLQSVRGNHTVEAHFAGQAVELVAVCIG